MPFDYNFAYWFVNAETGEVLTAPHPGGADTLHAFTGDWDPANQFQIWHFESPIPAGHRMRAAGSTEPLGWRNDGRFVTEPTQIFEASFGVVRAEEDTVRLVSGSGRGVVTSARAPGGEVEVMCFPDGGLVGQHWRAVEADPHTVTLPTMPPIPPPASAREAWLLGSTNSSPHHDPSFHYRVGDLLDSIAVRLIHDQEIGQVADDKVEVIQPFLDGWLLHYGGENIPAVGGVIVYTAEAVKAKIEEIHEKITPDSASGWDEVKDDLDNTGLEPSTR